MADVFIFYPREDRQAVEKLSALLEAAGLTCWWDKQLTAGTRYLEKTEAELVSSKAVLVIWTKHSIASHWVADEAGIGRDAGRLVPISLDGSLPPLGFRQFQAMDFSGFEELIRVTCTWFRQKQHQCFRTGRCVLHSFYLGASR